jgi:hypothetical protein
METVLEKKGHIKRYATKEEMSKCIECLVEQLWQDAVKNKERIIFCEIDFEKGEQKFKEEETLRYEDILGFFGIVDYFPEENCSLITTSDCYIDENDSCVYSTPSQFINVEGVYSCVEAGSEFFNFKLNIFIKKTISSLQNTVGRPNRPTDNSIEKSILILDAIKEDKFGIDFVCEEIGLPKSTYYKTIKWLEKNSISLLNKKN